MATTPTTRSPATHADVRLRRPALPAADHPALPAARRRPRAVDRADQRRGRRDRGGPGRLGGLGAPAPRRLPAQPRDRPVGARRRSCAGTTAPDGETVFTSRRGITSHHANPWVMVDDGDGRRGARRGLGRRAGVERHLADDRPADTAGRRTSVTAGFGHDGVVLARSAPAEPLVTPVAAGLYTERRVRRREPRAGTPTSGEHVLPHPRELRPVLYNSWEATGFDVDAGRQARAGRACRRARASSCSSWTTAGSARAPATTPGSATGGSTADASPTASGRWSTHVHGLGMAFGLWVEPEMVNPDSDLYRAHPDWVLHQPHRRPLGAAQPARAQLRPRRTCATGRTTWLEPARRRPRGSTSSSGT